MSYSNFVMASGHHGLARRVKQLPEGNRDLRPPGGRGFALACGARSWIVKVMWWRVCPLRVFAAALCACLLASCRDSNEGAEPSTAGVAFAAPPVEVPAPDPPPPPFAPPLLTGPSSPQSWTFVAMSDLHIPNNAEATATVKR